MHEHGRLLKNDRLQCTEGHRIVLSQINPDSLGSLDVLRTMNEEIELRNQYSTPIKLIPFQPLAL